jgi:hypothetical protein
MEIGEPMDHFTDTMFDLLHRANFYSISPAELEQFAYDISVSVQDNRVVVTTEEIDVSAFLKVLIDSGARVEVFSTHDYPDQEYGRGRRVSSR